MKRLFFAIMIMAAVSVITGCFTSATAHTKRTLKDGSVIKSKVSIVGTGDKAASVAADGLFADGSDEDLGAGVKNAKASQQSTGIDGTLAGMGTLMIGMAKFMAASQGLNTPDSVGISGASSSSADTDNEPVASSPFKPLTEPPYSTDGYGGSPGADGEGVYGRPSCGRCRAYHTAHPETPIINLDVDENRTALWSALRKKGFTGASADLPVVITADGYTASAK